MTVSEQLRRIVLECGRTTYRIGTDAGINVRTIDRFVKEEKPATTDTFDALCEYFGLELAEKKPETATQDAGKKKPGIGRKQAVKKPATKRRARKSAD